VGTQNKIKQKLKQLIQQPRGLFQLTPAHQFNKLRRPMASFLYLKHETSNSINSTLKLCIYPSEYFPYYQNKLSEI